VARRQTAGIGFLFALKKPSLIAEDESVAEPLEPLKFGRIGEYVLAREVGRGTHYTLFQALDPRDGRMVVIKILHVSAEAEAASALSDDDGSPPPERETAQVLEARLEREANALARLSHPGILGIHETGAQDGYRFLVMEYVHAHPLRQHLDKRALPPAEVVDIFEQVANAVDAVHAEGILHRDIRPSNIMVAHDGQVKLVNFGLARQPGDASVTLMGVIVGEPAYLAPEQLHNQPASAQTDLWALGVLLYEMLAGKPPFEGANFTLVAHQVLMAAAPPIANVSPAVQSVVDRALEKDPAQRFGSAREMASALRKAVGKVSEPALSFAAAPPAKLACYKRAAVLAACALGLAAYALLGSHLLHPDPEMPAAPPAARSAPLAPAPAAVALPPAAALTAPPQFAARP